MTPLTLTLLLILLFAVLLASLLLTARYFHLHIHPSTISLPHLSIFTKHPFCKAKPKPSNTGGVEQWGDDVELRGSEDRWLQAGGKEVGGREERGYPAEGKGRGLSLVFTMRDFERGGEWARFEGQGHGGDLGVGRGRR